MIPGNALPSEHIIDLKGNHKVHQNFFLKRDLEGQSFSFVKM